MCSSADNVLKSRAQCIYSLIQHHDGNGEKILLGGAPHVRSVLAEGLPCCLSELGNI